MPAIAFFDFDGTTTHEEMFTPFIKYAAPKHRLLLGRLCLASTIIRYKHFNMPAHLVRPKVAGYAFKGLDEEALKQKGKDFSVSVIPEFVRTNALERMQWHKDRGDKVVLVSASLSLYLKPWCDLQGIELLSSDLEFNNNKATGRYATPDCSSEEKVIRIKAQYKLSEYDAIYAYGDTPEDYAMLNIADYKSYQWSEME